MVLDSGENDSPFRADYELTNARTTYPIDGSSPGVPGKYFGEKSVTTIWTIFFQPQLMHRKLFVAQEPILTMKDTNCGEAMM